MLLRVTTLACVIGLAQVAFAQEGGSPRAQGLFGGFRPDANAAQRLDVGATLLAGYDSDVPERLRPAFDPSSPQSGGYITTVDATLDYNVRGAKAELGISGASTVRHYHEVGQTQALAHSVGAGLAVRMPGHSTLLVNQAVAYAPTYFAGLFPVAATLEPGANHGPLPDLTVNELESFAYTTDATLSHNFDPRTRISASGQFAYTDRRRETESWSDVSSEEVRVQFGRNTTRNTAFNVGARYRSGALGYTSDQQTRELGIDIALDYNQRLSATRQIRYRFGLGPSAADMPDTVDVEGTQTVRRYVLSAEVGVDYAMTRSWQVQANYRRGLEYVVDLPEPVVANGFSAALDGLLSRRVDVTISAGYSSGASALNRSSLTYDTYAGGVRARYAISRAIATDVQYLYYFYDFRGTDQIIGPSSLERNGVRAGLTMWVPALRR